MTRFGIIKKLSSFKRNKLFGLSILKTNTIHLFNKNLCLKSSLRSFVILTLFAGGLLLGSSGATFAAGDQASHAQNTSKETSVTNYIHSYGVEKIKSGKSNKLQQAITNAQNASNQYVKIRDSYRSNCSDTIDSALYWLKDLAADAFQAVTKLEFDYSENANQVIALCAEAGKPLTQEQQDNLRALAEKTDSALREKEVLSKAEGYGDDIYQHCYTPKNAKDPVCTQFVVNTEDNTLMAINGASAGCSPLPFKLYEARSCLFCPLFRTIFNTIQNASSASFKNLGKPMSTLILIGLAIWIALMVLQNVSSMTRQDPFEFITKLLRASFKVIIAYFLLKDPVIIYSYILGPILKAGFEFGAAFLDNTKDIVGSCQSKAAFTSSAGGVFPAYLQRYLLCFIEAVQFELATSQAIGSSLMCVSRNAALSNLGPIARVMPDFNMMLQGALIYIISLILSLAYAFYLVDATIQLGIFGILLPFIILCMPFKITNNYFKTGVGVFMNSWFVYVFMGIVVNIVMQLIGQSLTGGKGGLTDVETAINGNEVRKLQELLGIGFSGFLILLACCIFGVKLMMKVTDLADQFSGGGLNLGIGAKVGALGAQAATGVAKGAVNMGKSAAKGVYNAKVWKGEDGKYRGLSDGVNAVGKAMAGAGTSAVRGVAHAVFHPQKSMRSVGKFIGKMRGKGRRDPSE